MPARRSRLPALLVITLLSAGCPGGLTWSPQEKADAQHVVRSLRAAGEASALAARLDLARATPAERGAVAERLRAARVAAALVNESTLRKAHGELPKRWHREYQPALAGLEAFYREGRAPRGGDPAARLNAFLAWYRDAQPAFRWWDGGPEG